MDKQTGKLVARIAENLPEMSNSVMQGWIQKPRELQTFLSGLSSSRPAPAPEPLLDSFVCVHDSRRVFHPGWVRTFLHPELQATSPAEYDLSTTKLWLHDGQKCGAVTGNTIYDQLKKDNALTECLGFYDLVAIAAKGVVVFHSFYANKAVFGWRSVVLSQDDELRVPFLCEHRGTMVMLNWGWVGDHRGVDSPALRF